MKRVLVTGGSRGIGLATARLFARNGYAVTAVSSSGTGEGDGVAFVRADVRSEEDAARVLNEMPSLDVLVLNAGVDLYKQVQDVSDAEFSRVMDVNVKGAFFYVNHAVKKMLGSGGAIVFVSSVWGETGGSCESVYSASKGALIAFSKALAKELAPSNITVNCVSPGVIDTAMNARLTAEERAATEEEIPLGRFGSAEEVARAVLFVAEHPYITGQNIGVNGGFYI